jgi:hypothetical protein
MPLMRLAGLTAMTLGTLTVVSTAFFPPTVEAQQRRSSGQKPPAKIYRWVDAQGNVRFSDTLPAEAVDGARSEISRQSGNPLADIERNLTPEERAQKAAEEAEILAAQQRELQLLHDQKILIQTFPSLESLKADYEERRGTLRDRAMGERAGMEDFKVILLSHLQKAADIETAGHPVPADIQQAVASHYALYHEKQLLLVKLDQDIETLNQQELAMIEAWNQAQQALAGQLLRDIPDAP